MTETVRVEPNPTESGGVDLMSPEAAAAPQDIYRRMHKQCPVAHSLSHGGHVITRYEDVLQSFRDHKLFSSEMALHMGLGTERPMIPQQIDPPEQTRYRKILDNQFSRKRMKVLEPIMREQAAELLRTFADQETVEFNKAFAVPFPCRVFLSLMGLPQEDLDLFLEFKDNILRSQQIEPDATKAYYLRAATGKRIYAYFDKAFDRLSEAPEEDSILCYLLTVELDGKKLTRNELLDITFLFLLAGLDTVTASIGCFVSFLAQNPNRRQELVDDPSLIPNAVEELLRWETPVMSVPRVTKRECEISGVTIPENTMVSLQCGAANLDDEEFVDGDTVRWDRKFNRHLAFGGGVHRCLGSHLARMELQIMLEELLKHMPQFSLEPGKKPVYSPGIREVQVLPLKIG